MMVKRIASLDCVSVSLLGSVVILGSASLRPYKTPPGGFGGAACRFLRVQAERLVRC